MFLNFELVVTDTLSGAEQWAAVFAADIKRLVVRDAYSPGLPADPPELCMSSTSPEFLLSVFCPFEILLS